MDLRESGKLIAQLRKEAGYTQKSLADALLITDKAVSKWERGVCMPDASLLTKLSMLLDTDIDYLISGKKPYDGEKWSGIIDVGEVEHSLAEKPLLFYLLSYFALVGVTDVCIKTENKDYVKALNLSQYGFCISFDEMQSARTIILYEPFLLYGVNLTRQFQHCMSCGTTMIPYVNGEEIPLIFSHHYTHEITYNRQKSERKNLGRGTTFIRLQSNDDYADAQEFIRICEKHSGTKIADLQEISILRGLV